MTQDKSIPRTAYLIIFPVLFKFNIIIVFLIFERSWKGRFIPQRVHHTRRSSGQRCEEIYAYITEYVVENGYSPTFREVGKAVGLRASSTVSHYIHRLIDEGRITIDESKPRTAPVRISFEGVLDAKRMKSHVGRIVRCRSSDE